MKHAVLYLYCFFANIFGQMRHYLVNSSGKTGREAHELAVKVSAFVCTQNGAMPVLPDEFTK